MEKRVPIISKDLSSWIDARQSQGLYYFTRQDALDALRTSETAFKQAALRLAKKKRVSRVLGDFFVIIPLEFANTGILPAEWFIRDLMEFLRLPYYVGLLSAAAIHGAAHQQPQQFHVVTVKQIRKVQLHGLSIRFFVKKAMHATPLVSVKTQTGFLNVSTPEATAFDLIRYARSIGGFDRVMTVLQELGDTMDSGKIVNAAKIDGNLAYTQRLGWILERAGFSEKSNKLAAWIAARRPLPTKLDPSLPVKGARKDKKWGLIVNADVESDL